MRGVAPPAGQPFAEVIGDPIAHSKSPLIHGFWLDQAALSGVYQATHVAPPDLATFIAGRRDMPEWRGCNVTLPHKQAVMELVDDPGDVRASIGAMNTLFRGEDGRIAGTNTDAAGFFAPISDRDWAGAHAIVVGSGGAACAVLYALKQAGFGTVTMVARSPLKAMGLLARMGLKGAVQALDAALPPADLLVNASSLGMKGQPDYAPDLAPLAPDALVYDLVYAPLVTPLLAAADGDGRDWLGGLDMLVGQAALAFALFYGQDPPRDADDRLFALLEAV